MLFLSCEFIGTTQNFRNGTLIFHKRKLIGILNSSSYTRKGQRVEFWARSGWGPGLPGGGLWEEPGWGGRQQGEACSHKASSPIGQVAALQVQLIFLITEHLAAGQDQGGQF